ncbi:MAG TPA: RuBisCO large subunit C-terminal-like domain-containing protein [Nitrospira sp.]|nr:RuBisCO large subunit C-terminal-like domain-containing protein [Nitrospira sp.]
MPDGSSRSTGLQFSGERFSVEYRLHGSAADARRRADLLCIDQTVEAADHVIPSGAIRDQLLGRVIQLEALTPESHRAVVSFPIELLDGTMSALLHMIIGMAGLQGQIRVTDLSLPDAVVSQLTGPRFGSRGLRDLLQVPRRPLLCAVLKPLGYSPQQLAELAHEFALGEVDLIKDDQSLRDHPFCRFEERVARCAEAVAKASRQTGKRCLYAPHISGSWPSLMEQAAKATQTGAGALLLCPGLTGFDAMASLAQLSSLSPPLIAHPDFLGSHYVPSDSDIAPAVLFGLLPRLAGADITIYPTYGLNYPISEKDCRQIAAACRRALGGCPSILPTAAGRMTASRIREMVTLYGSDLVFILGSDLRREPTHIRAACLHFLRLVEAETEDDTSPML